MLLFFTEKVIIATWDRFRENFRKALNRRKRASKSGSSGNPTSKCRFFDELSFLNGTIGVRVTQSNIQPDVFTPPASPMPIVSQADIFTQNTQNNNQTDIFTREVSPPIVRRPFPSINTSCSGSSTRENQTARQLSSQRERSKKRKPVSESSVTSVLETAILADVEKAKEVEKEKNDSDVSLDLYRQTLRYIICPSAKGLTYLHCLKHQYHTVYCKSTWK